jgi:putative transposase
VALGVNLEGKKELLGLWLAETEGAKFWLSCLTDLQSRGLADIFVACIDGLSGFAEAIHTAYPQTSVQLCLVPQRCCLFRRTRPPRLHQETQGLAGFGKVRFKAVTDDLQVARLAASAS